MQKILPISIFILLNTLLPPIITNFIAILYLGSIIVVDDPKEVITPYIYILTVFFIMRIIILPIFYTLTKSTNSILQNFFNLLKKNNIYTIGRYGAWIYNSMEDSMVSAKELAEKI